MLDQPLNIVVRPSTEDDVAAMIAIYTYHIQHGLSEYQTEPLYPDDIKRRRKAMLKRRLPHLVADHAGQVVGYAYAVPFSQASCVSICGKHSIYVHKDYLHSGVGRKLLPELIDFCARGGYRQMISYVDSANTPSLQLHESVGFERAGFLQSIGFKFGQWTDTVIMQRPLGPGNISPPGDLATGLGGSTPHAL